MLLKKSFYGVLAFFGLSLGTAVHASSVDNLTNADRHDTLRELAFTSRADSVSRGPASEYARVTPKKAEQNFRSKIEQRVQFWKYSSSGDNL